MLQNLFYMIFKLKVYAKAAKGVAAMVLYVGIGSIFYILRGGDDGGSTPTPTAVKFSVNDNKTI